MGCVNRKFSLVHVPLPQRVREDDARLNEQEQRGAARNRTRREEKMSRSKYRKVHQSKKKRADNVIIKKWRLNSLMSGNVKKYREETREKRASSGI